MSRLPARQLSLQQPPKRGHTQQHRAHIRRQRSADDNRTHGSMPLIYHSIADQPVRSRKEKTNWANADRPKVRIAWSSVSDDSPKVEVIASRIGTSANKSGRSNGSASGSSSIIGSDKATILYSRQELAERLRLAWKQREANKSNIDIFLAHGTTADDSRCESRLSSASCDPSKTCESEKVVKEDVCFTIPPVITPTASFDNAKEDFEKDVKVKILDARAKRASFQSGTNLAFTGTTAKNNNFVSPIIKDMTSEKVEKIDKLRDRSTTPLIEPKAKRTNSAPPIPRRATSTTLAVVTGASSRAKVNIIIDTPKIGKPKDIPNQLRDLKVNVGKGNPVVSPYVDDTWSVKETSIRPSSQVGTITIDKPKSNTTKKRARSGKRRVDDAGRKSELSKSNPDVITMVSLVSDADSDSENESNSPVDDKLVRQLRSNLPTTPIIKSFSPLLMNPGTLTVSSAALDTSLMPRRVLKSVSFQQDSVDGEIHLRPTTAEKKCPYPNDGLSKMMLQQAQIQQIIRGSAGLTEEIKTTWQPPDISCTTVDVPMISSPTPSNYWKDADEESATLTDREKRCLVVPIGDPRDKKRKLLLQRTKSVPSQTLCEDSQTALQIEAKETFSVVPDKQVETLSSIHRTGATSISLQANISKQFIRGISYQESTIDMDAVDVDIQSMEPQLRTTKEKECWHLYRKMCDKGVCVSFDTVLRGMLTPTEYRLRRREVS